MANAKRANCPRRGWGRFAVGLKNGILYPPFCYFSTVRYKKKLGKFCGVVKKSYLCAVICNEIGRTK